MSSRRVTYTYALVSFTQEMFDCVKLQLEEAGYEHAVIQDDECPVIDMHGLALTVGPAQTVPQYAVVKQGVYIQGVHAPFVRLEDARIRAQQLADADGDDYHSYDVWTISAEDGLLEQMAASYRKGGRADAKSWAYSAACEEHKTRRTPC